MTRTLTDEQWDVIRDAASEHAAETAALQCEPDCPHQRCQRNRDDANEIRRVLADVEGDRSTPDEGKEEGE